MHYKKKYYPFKVKMNQLGAVGFLSYERGVPGVAANRREDHWIGDL
jgi:hypothetical protein